jgi:hypothetical protein
MAQETNGDEDRGSRSYAVYYWTAVGCAAILAGLGVASSQADAIGITRQWLGIIAVVTAMIGVVAAALPSIRKPPRKATPPVVEPKPPGPPLEEPHE